MYSMQTNLSAISIDASLHDSVSDGTCLAEAGGWHVPPRSWRSRLGASIFFLSIKLRQSSNAA